MEGQLLADRYLLKEEIGRGGMAIIYTGNDTLLKREVAIKILYPHLISDSNLMQRFINEARIIAKLNYRSIVSLYDIAEHEGIPFLVLEYIHGYNLRELYERLYKGERKPPLETALVIASIVCDAVAHAHSMGIVHRDIKPENVLISDQGDMKITDFGLAHILADTRITASGVTIGSPEFMSPEHISSSNISTASDVFSLGSLIYWLITGVPPFSADNTMSILTRISRNDYERTGKKGGIDDCIAGIVDKSLKPDPLDRYKDAAELSNAIHNVIDGFAPDPYILFKSYTTAPGQTARELAVRHNRIRYENAVAYIQSNRFEKALALISTILETGGETGDDSVDVSGLMRQLKYRKYKRLAISIMEIVIVLLLSAIIAREDYTGGFLNPSAAKSVPLTPVKPGIQVKQEPAAALQKKPKAPRKRSAPAGKTASQQVKAAYLHQPVKTAENNRKPDIGSLELITYPWAMVFIDGKYMGETPRFKTISLSTGKHEISIMNPYLKPHSEVIEIKPGQTLTKRINLNE